jgi:hypothetical protein
VAVDRDRGIVFAFGFFDYEQINWTRKSGEPSKMKKVKSAGLKLAFIGVFLG